MSSVIERVFCARPDINVLLDIDHGLVVNSPMSHDAPAPSSDIAVLLLHGFGGCRAGVQPWADALAEHGYVTRVPLLPGHGTSWQDVARTTWKDWYGAALAEFDSLKAQHRHVFIGGLSLGGSLAMRTAADRGSAVAGVLLVNPAADLSGPKDWMIPVLKHLIPSVAAVHDIKKPGASENSYDRTSVKAGHSAIKAMKPLVRDLPRLTAPLLYFRSVDDHIIPDLSHELVMANVGSEDKQLRLLEDSYHVATLDFDAPIIFEESAEFIGRVTATCAS